MTAPDVGATPAEGLEREVKLDLEPAAPLPDLSGLPGVARLEAGPARDLDATYWDSAEGGLLALGWTLRRRTGEGAVARWTLKVPSGDAVVAGLARAEVSVDDDAEDPPAVLVERVRSVVAAPLVPVARLRSRRRPLALRDADGRLLAEVADDRVDAQPTGGLVATFREVEVELGPAGGEDLLAAVAARLVAAGAVPADPRPKLARALAPGAGDPPSSGAA